MSRKTGRPTKATDARIAGLLNALRAGNTRSAAAAHAEISRQTFYRWIEEDETFRDSVEKAEADAEVRFAAQVAHAASTGTWQAAAWWLERRRPADFALRSKLEMTGKDGGPIDHRDVSELNDHEKVALAEAIRDHLESRRGSEVRVGGPSDGEPGDGV